MTPLASIIVPTYLRNDLLRRCLDALVQQDFDPSKYEVVVADDAGCSATRELVAQYAGSQPQVHYEKLDGNHGPAAARNTGWRAARGRWIAFTDDDCIPDRSWLRCGVAALESGADAATGRVLVPLPDRPTDSERDLAGLETAEFVTANCFLRREALETVGGFDERFRMAWREDSDLHFSLLRHGFEIVRATDALVVHPVRSFRWGACIGAHRKTMFDALLYKKHPELYRQKIPPIPWQYDAMTLACLAAIIGVATTRPALQWAGGIAWLGMTAEFAYRRLRGNSRHPSHVLEMIFTSAVIPPVSLYWRVRGAIRFQSWAAY